MISAWSLGDIDLTALRQAFVHTSAVAPHSTDSNERLEFLGDSILNASVADFLFTTYPDWSEGELAKARSLVVCKASLYDAGLRINLPDLIVVGANVEGTLARGRRSLVADAMEALYAVIYLAHGWEAAKKFILDSLAIELSKVNERQDLRDPKTILQERSQALREPAPVYTIVGEEGKAHSRTFVAEVHVHSGQVARGSGRSKKDAEQAAAARVLESLTAPETGLVEQLAANG